MAEPADKQIGAWLKDINNAVKQYEKRDRRNILKKAANPVWISAVRIAPIRGKKQTKNTRGSKLNPRYRYKGKYKTRAAKGSGKPLSYYAVGNLKDSISILSFRRSVGSVFVGPYYRAIGKTKPTILGSKQGVGDGYYAQMVFGSARKFNEKVLAPAGRANFQQVRAIVFSLTKKSIVNKAKKR